MILIYREKEMKKYYNKKINTYVFDDDVEFAFDVNVKSHIKGRDIYANNINAFNVEANDIMAGNINVCDINANDIKAYNIDALGITANDISYFAVCFAYDRICCNYIKGIHPKAKHFVLDGELIIGGKKYDYN